MFGEKCTRCGKRVGKKHEFCSSCGLDLKNEGDDADYGLLGKNDMNDFDFNLPRGLNMLLKPLMKELTKQMGELDKEIRREGDKNPGRAARSNFSISFGTPGGKPIKIDNFGEQRAKQVVPQRGKKVLRLPKVSEDKLKKIKKLEKNEPDTNVRRLSDRIIYEISLPGVGYIDDINISNLENVIEVKAFLDELVYEKNIEISLPLINYSFGEEMLVLEFGLR
jgi:hypothetical protein